MAKVFANHVILRSYKHHAAKKKKDNSRRSLKKPGVGTGAFPDRLGSSGTANVPQITANEKGITKAKTDPSQPSILFQAQMATMTRLASSRRNRNNRFTGWEPSLNKFIGLSLQEGRPEKSSRPPSFWNNSLKLEV